MVPLADKVRKLVFGLPRARGYGYLGLGLEERHREREPGPWAPMSDRSLQFVGSQQRVPELMQALACVWA